MASRTLEALVKRAKYEAGGMGAAGRCSALPAPGPCRSAAGSSLVMFSSNPTCDPPPCAGVLTIMQGVADSKSFLLQTVARTCHHQIQPAIPFHAPSTMQGVADMDASLAQNIMRRAKFKERDMDAGG